MSERSPSAHPYEQLADYVDGSASPGVRAAVQAHLARCATCRDQVSAAAGGLAAARRLDLVDAPAGLVDAVLEAATRTGELALRREAAEQAATSPSAVRHGWGRRRSRSPSRLSARVLYGGGVAAAAAVTIALLVLTLGGPKSPSTTTGAAARPGNLASPAPTLVSRGANYTTAGLVSLASRLARHYSSPAVRSAIPNAPVPLPSASAAAPSFGAGVSPEAGLDQAPQCLLRGGAPTLSPVYLEQATVDGQPAFIGAYLESAGAGAPTRLAIVAVTDGTCQPIFLTSRNV